MPTLARKEAIGNSWLPMHLEIFGLVISCVLALRMLARIGQELSTVHGKRSQGEGTVAVEGKCAMLPLQDSLRTGGIFCCSADVSISGIVERQELPNYTNGLRSPDNTPLHSARW